MEREHEKYQQLIARCASLQPVSCAIAHPCDESSLRGALEAAEQGLIAPILVGPQKRIEAIAADCGLGLAGLSIADAPHSEAAAEAAVRLAREGKDEALMKGSLHTDELMSAVVNRETGLRTNRRISHCFVMDVPALEQALIITDAAVNIAPTLKDKLHIVQNAIDLAHILGRPSPKVANLSATETLNPSVPSTIEAAALCKMADRGQITGGILDGPLALDDAIDLTAAKIKHIESPVDLAGADAAGIVLGARVPIILTSRADSVMARRASCAVAVLMAHARRERVERTTVR